ncbi:hypothetical protein DMN91_002103 [Ooceraea biroi]|uniref:Uncharacterized protein n=1 Tax=Ooceraea biroi TaxID=2015173 RepID=A0A3L8DZN4_OOCBI|nr:hypothetical protein DMN91_002103 [Ooceraea biroi]
MLSLNTDYYHHRERSTGHGCHVPGKNVILAAGERELEPISTVPPLNQRQLRTMCHACFPQVIRIDDYYKAIVLVGQPAFKDATSCEDHSTLDKPFVSILLKVVLRTRNVAGGRLQGI